MGYSDVGISSLEWGNIIILIRNLKNALNTSSDLNNVFIAGISSSPTLDYQFLDEYLDSVLLLEDREEMITFYGKNIYKNRLFTRGEKRVVKGNGFDCIVQYKPLGSYLINISFEKKSRLNECSVRRLLIFLREMIPLMLLRGLRKNRRECRFR